MEVWKAMKVDILVEVSRNEQAQTLHMNVQAKFWRYDIQQKDVQGSYLQHFIFFVTYEWAQSATALHYARLERLARDRFVS
jgi:hypothetical protein